MNFQTKIRLQNTINEKELQLGYTGDASKSWHKTYKNSPWIWVGGLDYDLNEGDLLSIFSQYGEICNVNLIRDYRTFKSKGFAYIRYMDYRSTNCAVDNFNGIKVAGRILQVDHRFDFEPPRSKEEVPEKLAKLWNDGCAPKPINISKGLFFLFVYRIVVIKAYFLDEIRRDAEEQEERRKKALAKAEELVTLEEDAETKKIKRKVEKELKKAKKREKKERKRARRGSTPPEERGSADDAGRWGKKRKEVDYRNLKVRFFAALIMFICN